MKMFIRKVVIFLMLTLFGITTVQSASLQAKIDYMEKLKQEAATLEEQGYYDKSTEKSLKVQQLAGEIDVLIAVLKKWNQLQKNIAVAKQVGADRIASEEFNLGVDFYRSAEQAFVDEDLEQAEFDIDAGLYYIELAIEKAQETFNQQAQENLEEQNAPYKVEVAKVAGEYVVRLIPKKRDCLWRIAEYDFIYGNPWQWRKIYDANRDIIDDPDLIYPGQKLVIPPLPYEPDLE